MRKASTFSLPLLGLLAGLALRMSYADENPLIGGSWRWDNNKTLANFKLPTTGSDELKRSADKAKSFVEGAVANLHSNMVLTYRENQCEQVIFSDGGRVLSRETFPYQLIRVDKTFVIIDEKKKDGGIVKLFRDGDDSLYVLVQVGSYQYRDYFTREKRVDVGRDETPPFPIREH